MDLDNLLPFSIINDSEDKIRLVKDITLIFNKKYNHKFLKDYNIINNCINSIQSVLKCLRETFILELQDSSNPVKQLEIYKWISNLYMDNDLFNKNSYDTLLVISKEFILGSDKTFKKEINRIFEKYEETLERANASNAETIKQLYDQLCSTDDLTIFLHQLNEDKFNIQINYPKEKNLFSTYKALISNLELKIKYPIKTKTSTNTTYNSLDDIILSNYQAKSFLISEFLIQHNIFNVEQNKWKGNKGIASMLFKALLENNIINCTETTFRSVMKQQFQFDGELKPRQHYKRLTDIFGKSLKELIENIKS